MSDTKRILITGASQGFGHDTAKALAEGGHTVFATMRGIEGKNRSAAEGLRAWAETGGHALHVLELDVTNQDSITAAVGKATQEGPLDTVINNAGVGTFGVQESFSTAQVQAIFDVNVFGPLRVNQAVLPSMRKAGKGHIIYVSSALGRVTMPFLGPYGASKYALEALAEAADMELKPLGIAVTVIQPGAYGTGFAQNAMQADNAGLLDDYGPVKQMFEGFNAHFAQMVQSGAMGDPSEVVDAIVATVDNATPPLRVPVGADMKEGVDAINGVSAQVQAGLRQAFGLG
ncbi:MAG: SDR family oxidoreductase [Myxococcota bacterium]